MDRDDHRGLQRGWQAVAEDRLRLAVTDKLTRLQGQKLDGTLTATSKQTVAAYLATWLENTVRLSVRGRTHENYRQNMNTHVTPRVGGLKLDRLTPANVQGIYAAMETAGKSARTRQLVHLILRRALQQALKWGYVVRNVCDAVDRPTVDRTEMNVLTAEQTGALLETVAGDRLEALYVLAVTGGLRQGELLALEWSDIDFSAGTLSVQRTLFSLNGEFATGQPKSERSRRLVHLPRMAVDALHERRRLALVEGLGGNARMPDGTPIKRDWLSKRHLRDALAAAKLPTIRFHDLRHTAATLLLAQGVHPKVVQERLGHSSVQLTLDTYSHVLPSMQQDAADRLDRMFPAKSA